MIVAGVMMTRSPTHLAQKCRKMHNELARRIRDHFFGELLSKDTLSGKIVKIDSAEVEVELSMNKISKNVVLKIEQKDNEYLLTGAINVLDWKAEKGLKGINDACKDLHKGADGISKTWADVNLYISTILKEKCD